MCKDYYTTFQTSVNNAVSAWGHFGHESSQAVDCTGTDNQIQANKTLHTTQIQKINGKNCTS